MQLILSEDGDESEQGPSHLERNVLVFGFFSHLCLIWRLYQVVGNLETNCLLGTSFESHGPFIYNCTTHFCFVIFYLWHGKSFQYQTPLFTYFSSRGSLHDVYKIIVYKICIVSDSPKNNKGSCLIFPGRAELEIVNDQEWGEKPIPLPGIEGYSKKAGICGTIEVVCLEPHRIRSKMDVSAPRKGFCLNINLFYIFAAIFLPLNYLCTCFFLIAFIS